MGLGLVKQEPDGFDTAFMSFVPIAWKSARLVSQSSFLRENLGAEPQKTGSALQRPHFFTPHCGDRQAS
jgi:hypothetical protein